MGSDQDASLSDDDGAEEEDCDADCLSSLASSDDEPEVEISMVMQGE